MTRTSLLLTLVAAAALAGCNEDQTIVAGPDSDPANQAPASNEPITLPPSIIANHSYRCGDNSIVQIEWLSDNQSANFRTDEGRTIHLEAPEPGEPMTADGYALTGTPDGPSIRLERPERGTQTCKR